MIYKEYGKTGKKVSAVGFGGMRFDLDQPDKDNADLLVYAYQNGINYFDTAPGYCEDKSEDIFGLAFRQMTDVRDKFFVSTKGMPTTFDTADKAREGVQKSLKRLNVEKIDFYHVWCIRKMEHYELAMKKGGQYEGLLKCKEDGLIDHITISTHLPGQEVDQILSRGEFDGVLLGVNILNFLYRWEGVQKAYDTGMGVVAMNPLAGGTIAKHADKLAFLGGNGETPVEAALRFCISCPQITIALNGFTTKEHIDTACRVSDNCPPFSQAEIDRVKKHIAENMNTLCTGCGYCRASCEQNIPVDSYMQIYNEKLISNQLLAFSTPLLDNADMVKSLDFHRNWGLIVGRKADAGDCTECGQCEEDCTQHLNIIERLKEIAQWEK